MNAEELFTSPETGKPFTGVAIGRQLTRPLHVTLTIYREGIAAMPQTEFGITDAKEIAQQIVADINNPTTLFT